VTNYILWDVDGTLVLNGKDAGNLYHEAIELALGQTIAVRLPNTHGKTDGQILRESLAAHGLDENLHTSASTHLDELSRLRFESGNHREAAPGAAEALLTTARAGWVNALLTGNSANRSRYKVTGAGMPAELFDWEHSYFGHVTPIRSDLTLRAVADHPGDTLVIIGDTPGDDIAATAAGIPFIAVATGAYTAAELRKTGALLVVDDLFSGLPAVMEMLSAVLE
jgi:phosphoglycolate phosphatase-like HAD superfamily hydrolase